jgi:succinoglycan biosynthesis transport protein ExoP
MDLIYLFKVLMRKLWLLIVIPIIAACIGFFYAFTGPEEFKSTAQLSTGITTRGDVPFEDDGFNLREIEIKFNNLMELMKSDLVVSLVSYKLILHDLEGDRPFRVLSREEMERNPLANNPEEVRKAIAYFKVKLDSMQVLSNFEEYDRQLIKVLKLYGYDHTSLKAKMNFERIKFTDYILISCFSDSPSLSAFVVNQLCTEFIRYNYLNNIEKSDATVKFFANMMAQSKKELDEKSQALKEFRYDNRVLDPTAEGQLQEQQIQQYELLAEQERGKIRQLTFSMNNVQERINRIKSTSPNSTEARALNQKILTLRLKIQNLNQRYIESGGNNKAMEDSLVILRRDFQNATEKVNSLAATPTQPSSEQSLIDLENQFNQHNVDLQIAESQLSSHEFKLRTLKAGKSNIATIDILVSDLQREIDVASKDYIDAQEKYNAARNTAMAAGSTIKQVMVGQPAFSAESKHTMVITLASWLSSLSICVFVILVIEFLDFSIKTPSQFKKMTKLKIAGTLNHVKIYGEKKLTMRELFAVKGDADADTFKHLLRNLRYEIETSRQKVFLFTSTKPGEGKTFTIISLAYSLSLIQKKVLIVDTNFKNNQLTKILSEHKEREQLPEGKTTQVVRSDQWDDDSSKNSLITPTIYQYVDKIVSKTSSKSASEILIEKDFGGLLQEITSYYDYVFLEGASLNDHSDTKELSEFADRIVPVFSSHSVIKQIDQESITYLKSLGNKLFGAVLNNINIRDLKL